MATFPRTIIINCGSCGTPIPQPDDPGRRKEFCSGRCRTRAYRARNSVKWKTQQEAEREAWANEEARREQERQRSYKRRHGAPPPPPEDMPGYCTSSPASDSPVQVKQRQKCYLLMNVALHPTTPEHEAASARARAEEKRRKYKL